MTNKKQLKVAFFDALTPLLEKEGFALVSSQERYVRDNGDHRDDLWIAFKEIGNDLGVQSSAGIRYKQVEDIFHLTSGFPEEGQAWTNTVGASFGVLKGGTSLTYQIPLPSHAQAQVAAEELFSSYKQVGESYFAQWSTLTAIDAALNDDPSKRVPNLRPGLQWFRCSTGLIIAKLVGRSNYDELKCFYTEVMAKDSKGFYLERFRALGDNLSKIDLQS